METIKLNKSRSIKASIVDAWHLFALDWRKYLRSIFLPAVFAGLAGAAAFEVCLQYVCHYLQPAYRLHQTGADWSWVKLVMIPSWAFLAVLILSLLLLLIFGALYKAKMLGVIRKYAESAEFVKSTLGLKSDEKQIASKYTVMRLFFFFGFVLVCAVVTWGAFQWKKGLLYLLPVLLVYFWTTGNVSRLQYVFGQFKFFTAIKRGLKKSMGYAFIVQILTFIPMLLLYAVFLLPAAIYALAAMGAEDSALVGDPVIMPDMVSLVFFVLNMIGFTAVTLLNSVRTWSLTMKLNFFEEKEVVVEENEDVTSQEEKAKTE